MQTFDFRVPEYEEFERLMAKLFDQVSMLLLRCEDDIQGWRYDELHESILHLMAHVKGVRDDQIIYDSTLHKFFVVASTVDC